MLKRKFKRIIVLLEIALKGHIFNAFWKPKVIRQNIRSSLINSKFLSNYLVEYLPSIDEMKMNRVVNVQYNNEKIFSIWFQGEKNAPDLVKSCFKSIRDYCGKNLIVLDENTIFKYIKLPNSIIKKYKSGKISRAHFADICRVELLYEHGGFWFDATCFVTSKIPNEIINQDFFMYEAGNICPPSFIQNCFIHAKKGSYLLNAWRNAIMNYWNEESRSINYFMHQLLFKSLIFNNKIAKKFFNKMLHIKQDHTHILYYQYSNKIFNKKEFKSITKNTFFQKCCHHADNIAKPNSYLDFILNYHNNSKN